MSRALYIPSTVVSSAPVMVVILVQSVMLNCGVSLSPMMVTILLHASVILNWEAATAYEVISRRREQSRAERLN